jgi:ABC-type thiamin/hydroxymethylpyrimidine transport system permease subunit
MIMRKTISIIGMAIALITIIYSFFAMGETGQLFGFKMNIWIYRLIWLALFGVILNGYIKESKKFN